MTFEPKISNVLLIGFIMGSILGSSLTRFNNHKALAKKELKIEGYLRGKMVFAFFTKPFNKNDLKVFYCFKNADEYKGYFTFDRLEMVETK